MDSNYILLSLYLGFFAPNDRGYGGDEYEESLLSNTRFLLSRVLSADDIRLLVIRDSDDKADLCTDVIGLPCVVSDSTVASEAERYSLHINGARKLDAASQVMSYLLDAHLIEQQNKSLRLLEANERQNLLSTLRKQYSPNILPSLGHAVVTPLDTYLLAINETDSTLKSALALFYPYEIIGLIGAVSLFESIVEENKYSSEEQYFLVTHSYSCLVQTPENNS